MPAESPDELAVRYEGLAARVARRHHWRLPPAAAGFDDLKQVCWAAVLLAVRDAGFDHRIPLETYAEVCADRAALRFARAERRRGLAARGRRAARFPDAGPPGVTGADDADPGDGGDRHPGGAWVPDHRAVWPDPAGLVAGLALLPWVTPRALVFADLAVRHGLTVTEIGRLFGVKTESVLVVLRPLRRFLRDGG